jgi:hypothetical protein
MACVVNFGDTPSIGDRILVLREEWMERIMNGEKTLEVRPMRLREGDIWLGCRSCIFGKARLGPAIAIDNEKKWAALRPMHFVASDTLPYKKTYGLPIKEITRLCTGIPYVHRRGAIGIVKFRPPWSEQME